MKELPTPCIFSHYKPMESGYIKVPGMGRLHKYKWEEKFGPVPDGLVLDHLCENKACINPDHLDAVTQAENIRRASRHNGNKTHCKQGHEYSPDNTYVRPSGGRMCRICTKISREKYKNG